MIKSSLVAIAVGSAVAMGNPATGLSEPLRPGDGDAFFISQILSGFQPSPPVPAVRAVIPIAHKVCDARAAGQDDLQAAHLVWTSKAVDTLGLVNGSVQGLEAAALDIVGIATLAYCPTYNNGNW